MPILITQDPTIVPWEQNLTFSFYGRLGADNLKESGRSSILLGGRVSLYAPNHYGESGDLTMSKLLVLLTLGLAVIIGFPGVALAQQTGFAQVQPVNGSDIEAIITFSDDGDTLKVIGVATRLDPTQTYVTLLYNVGSLAEGPTACLPTDDSLTFTQMVVGLWVVQESGIGTLTATKTGDSYVALGEFGTTSVRRDTQPDQPLPSAPDPNRFVLQACGEVLIAPSK
jgi:hypothetical protein